MNKQSDCGCCSGVGDEPLAPPRNRSGLNEIRHSSAGYHQVLEAMQARLSSRDYPALAGLKTRAPDDPSVALLDAWATLAQVLGFYNDRLANEGYLRTAIQQRSVTELARLVGYQPRPGVAASVFLAYGLDANAKQDTVIPKGARAQSIPGPGELPQSFETSDDLQARHQWNFLLPRMQRPYRLTRDQALDIDRLYLEGAALNLQTDDHILLVFDKTEAEIAAESEDEGKREKEIHIIRRVQSSEPLLLDNKTRVLLQPVFSDKPQLPVSESFAKAAKQLEDKVPDGEKSSAIEFLKNLKQTLKLGSWRSFEEFKRDATALAGVDQISSANLDVFFAAFTDSDDASALSTDIQSITNNLLKPFQLQPRNALRQQRTTKESFKVDSDAAPQLMLKLAPRLGDHFYAALANATLNNKEPELQAIYVLRLTTPLFGYNAPARTQLEPVKTDNAPTNFVTSLAPDWPLRNESSQELSLDNQYDAIFPSSYVLIERLSSNSYRRVRFLRRVIGINHRPRSDYQLSAKTTRLLLDGQWIEPEALEKYSLALFRPTLIRTQSEALQLAQEPIDDDIGLPKRMDKEPDADYQDRVENSRRIELDQVHPGLQAGRWLIVSGERSDIEATDGIIQSELAMLANVEQRFDRSLAGDKNLTTLTLETPLAYRYKRASVKIYGNVVKATHGETRSEALGGGNAAISMQAFTLKQPPLTYVSANTPAGAESTLEVYVNDLRWHETDSLAGQSPEAHVFVTKTDDEAKTTVIFGNGKEAARLPTGQENIKARYRNGIGKAGNVGAGQISLLASRPLGVKEVINPLAASGGADRETRDQARANAPLAIKALDRLVSVQDYEDFARLFAGIGKASARELSDGSRRLVHVTIAGADDIPIDETSDLFQNLYQALLAAGDPHQPLVLAVRELKLAVVSANIRILPDYLWEPVVTKVRATLLDTFSFARRALGQPLFLSEVISCIQSVPGVDYVDVDYLRGLPEKEVDESGERRLLTPEQINYVLTDDPYDKSVDSEDASDPLPIVSANLADVEEGGLRPAQLVFITPDVPATLILNPIP